ncbi:complement C1q tumor necrosis factor-related protein 4-like [Mercenaria mercenaria]|uniref:complement C1q tumor necrosis factor-related protein 4-like n=1 Tax=Mercenaria mercenaria TaxID=6596 RepID=UPI00234F0B5B|nr:complement C1q tumor necrosis factor-related protein 4-like [Mercenaria mercenaria]
MGKIVATVSAFSVYNPYNRTSDGVSRLTFSSIIYQHGNDFDLSSGTYKCSIPGTYYFAATLVKKRSSSRVDLVDCDLYKNRNKLIIIKVDPTDNDTDKGSAAISQSVVINLDKGDNVYLGSCSDPSTRMEYWSSFTGFLLYPDD